jgi:hypothetical protein
MAEVLVIENSKKLADQFVKDLRLAANRQYLPDIFPTVRF